MATEMLVTFSHNGQTLYSQHLVSVPAIGSYITIILKDANWKTEEESKWLVHAVEWGFEFRAGVGELAPNVVVHLKRLTQHQWNNRHEPTGYSYLNPYSVGPRNDG